MSESELGLSRRGENHHQPTYSHSIERITVLLPAYNEEDAIGIVIKNIREVGKELGGKGLDVLIVDGHSRDRTKEIASRLGIRVVVQPDKGKGAAVRFGIGQIDDHSAVVMLDADGTYPVEEIPKFVTRLEGGADVVVGSRLRGKIEEGSMSALNLIGNRLLSTLASRLYGRKISDVCSGMWAFRKELISKLRLNSVHFELEAELFSQACKANLQIAEVPITYRKRVGSPKLTSIRCGMSIAAKLLRKRFAP